MANPGFEHYQALRRLARDNDISSRGLSTDELRAALKAAGVTNIPRKPRKKASEGSQLSLPEADDKPKAKPKRKPKAKTTVTATKTQGKAPSITTTRTTTSASGRRRTITKRSRSRRKYRALLAAIFGN